MTMERSERPSEVTEPEAIRGEVVDRTDIDAVRGRGAGRSGGTEPNRRGAGRPARRQRPNTAAGGLGPGARGTARLGARRSSTSTHCGWCRTGSAPTGRRAAPTWHATPGRSPSPRAPGPGNPRAPGVGDPGDTAVTKLLYKPVGFILGAVAGAVAGALFRRVWHLASGDDDAPDPTDEDRAWARSSPRRRYRASSSPS